jgi:hypothetical protein
MNDQFLIKPAIPEYTSIDRKWPKKDDHAYLMRFDLVHDNIDGKTA